MLLGNAQGVDYVYNTRDWLQMINQQNINSSQDPGHDGSNGIPVDKFGEVIGYDVSGAIGAVQRAPQMFNGNISWLMYNMSGVSLTQQPFTPTSLVGYSYTYDKANRLKSADFGIWAQSMSGIWNWYPTNDYDVKKLVYSKNGNLDSLQRYNQSGILSDNLKYNYANNSNNMLTSISGSTSSTYTYDNNGNVLSDSYRGIVFIIYDSDNLPIRIYKTSGENQFYTYDMNGNRTRKTVTGSIDRFYFNGIDGKTEALCLMPYSSDFTYNIWGNNDNIGQVKVQNNSVIGRYYYLKDHLGNIKMTVNSGGTVIGYNDYYPFGKIMPGNRSLDNASVDNRYKFTSKERDTETGYDYFGARYYDSFIVRWLQVDPLAEKHRVFSPYNYAQDNPIRFIDPNGMETPEEKKTREKEEQKLKEQAAQIEDLHNASENFTST